MLAAEIIVVDRGSWLGCGSFGSVMVVVRIKWSVKMSQVFQTKIEPKSECKD